MKKRTVVLLATVCAMMGILAGCSGRVVYDGSVVKSAQVEENVTNGLKTGLALMPSVAKSVDAGEEDGLAQADISMAIVTVDAEGKVVSCAIDAAQVKINFDKEGKILTALDTQYLTKQELGDDYGMRAASSIEKEWNEQADAFAAYCIGKTADEISAIAADDADLTAGCTMHPGNFQWLVVKAMDNASASGAKEGDAIGLGVNTSIDSSVDASDEDGLAQAYVTVTGVTVDAEGKVTSAVIDSVQANVNFDAAGKITTDLEAEIKTKNELGDDYGMRKASSIGKEWNEQADAFAAYCIGKTADEIAAIAADDADLTAGCTMHRGNFQWLVVKAIGNAVESDANVDDKIGLGVNTTIDSSVDASEEDGLAQAYVTVTAATVDAEGKVTSAAIDSVQVNVNFDQSGKITTDLEAEIKTKNELGDDYGMRKASSIGKEWNEQAEAFVSYCIGMTADEITAIAEGDADLTAGCTMHPGNFQWVMAAAIGNAK